MLRPTIACAHVSGRRACVHAPATMGAYVITSAKLLGSSTSTSCDIASFTYPREKSLVTAKNFRGDSVVPVATRATCTASPIENTTVTKTTLGCRDASPRRRLIAARLSISSGDIPIALSADVPYSVATIGLVMLFAIIEIIENLSVRCRFIDAIAPNNVYHSLRNRFADAQFSRASVRYIKSPSGRVRFRRIVREQ